MPRLLAGLFVLIALPTCLMLAVLVPPGQVADEAAHIARADALGHFVLHGERRVVTDAAGAQTRQSGVAVDANLFAVAFILPPLGLEKLDAPRFAAHRALPWGASRSFVQIGSIATYFPVFYIPGAIGLAAARAAGGWPYAAILAGRICSALCFSLLGAACLALTRRGHATMFCALCCPMTLSLAASFNQDGMLIASSALAAALATRPEPRSRIGAALLIGCVAAVKLPYLPLASVLLLWRGESRWRKGALVAAVALPALLWTGIMMATVSAPIPRPPHPGGPLWPGNPATMFTGTDPAAQMQVLLAEPARLIDLPLHTLMHDPWLLPQAIGVLGWLNVLLPPPLYVGWAVAFALALLADLLGARDPSVTWRDTLLLSGAVVVAVWAIYLSQYLLWTDVGFGRVEGPTGRYFLPLLPLAALALPSTRLAGLRAMRLTATAAPVAMGLCGLIVLPAVIVGAYYLR